MPVIIFIWAIVIAILRVTLNMLRIAPQNDSLSLTNFFTLLRFLLLFNGVSFIFFALGCWEVLDNVIWKVRCMIRKSRTSHERIPRTPVRR